MSRDKALSHDGLLHSLANHLEQQGHIVFRDQNIGQAGSQRPDVLMIKKSYRNWQPTAFEVKASRSDFLADVTAGKWSGYYRAASAVVFALPKGLVKRNEIPQKAGLIIFNDGKWRMAKRPTIEPLSNLEKSTWLALMMTMHSQLQRVGYQPRAADFTRAAAERHELGDEIRQFIADKGYVRYKLEEQTKRAEKHIKKQYEELKKEREKFAKENPRVLDELSKILREHGIKARSPHWQDVERNVRHMIDQLQQECDADERLSRARTALQAAMHAVTMPGGEDE